MTRSRLLAGFVLVAATAVAGCASSGSEFQGLAELPPVDCAVLVTGGAYLTPSRATSGTFVPPPGADGEGGGHVNRGDNGGAASDEPIPIAEVVDVLERTGAFQRVALDPDAAGRRQRRDAFVLRQSNDALSSFLQRARADGFDLLLVVEELQDGPIEQQGTNSRWPVTFGTWILLGVGMLIPDRTFESRATLRVTLRELQTGRVLHDALLSAGPVDLALTERGDIWGILVSIIVPPFWVGDDDESVLGSVRATTERRLLLSLAREVKSESVRQWLRERATASLTLVDMPAGRTLVVDSSESIASVRLRVEGDDLGVDAAIASSFEETLLASVQISGPRYRYEAVLPPGLEGRKVQVLVGTLRGGVASATFVPGGRR